MIVENYRENGVPVEAFYASGGISQKDPMTMQIYADVLNMPVKIAGAEHGPAYGAALFGAVAGIMVYIAVEELIPSSRQYGHDRPALWATLCGICVMPLTHLFQT